MAISGGAKPSVQMQVIDNALITGRTAMRQDVVSSVDLAMHRLLSGEVVFVGTYASLPEHVTRSVEAVLRMRAKNGATGEKETN